MKKIVTLTIVVTCLLSVMICGKTINAASNSVEVSPGIPLYKDVSQGIVDPGNDTPDAGEYTADPKKVYWGDIVFEKLSENLVLLASCLSDFGKLDPKNIEAAATMFAENKEYKQQALMEIRECLTSGVNVDCDWQEVQRKLTPRSDNFPSKEEEKTFMNKLREPSRKEGISENYKGEWY